MDNSLIQINYILLIMRFHVLIGVVTENAEQFVIGLTKIINRKHILQPSYRYSLLDP